MFFFYYELYKMLESIKKPIKWLEYNFLLFVVFSFQI